MKEILLDTRIIIEYPNLLGIESLEYVFVTTDNVIEEIRNSGNPLNISYNERLRLIENAVQFGSIKLVSTNIGPIEEIRYSITSIRLDWKDKGLISYILHKRNLKEEVYLATTDKMLLKFAPSFNIKILAKDELDNLLITTSKRSESYNTDSIYEQIEDFESKENSRIRNGFFVGFVLSLIAFLIYRNIQLIILSAGIWITISSMILLSFILYIVREKWRLPYGFLEFSVGVFSVWAVFFQSNFHYKAVLFDTNFYIRIIGGIYIMVRGIDNMMIATKDTNFALKFKKFIVLNN